MVEHARDETDALTGSLFLSALSGAEAVLSRQLDRSLTAAIRLPYTVKGTAEASTIERSMFPVLAMSWAAASGVMTAET